SSTKTRHPSPGCESAAFDLNAWCELTTDGYTEGAPSRWNYSIFPKIRSTSMVDVDTFLTTLYVMTDDFCKTSLPPETHPGPEAALGRSETMTRAIFGQWQGFGSERGFYRYAQHHLRPAFPQLPTREQCNRQVRQHYAVLVAYFLYLGRLLAAPHCLCEALDSSGLPTRDAKRRGAGWL